MEKVLSCVNGQCSDDNFSLIDKSTGRRVFKLEFGNKSYYIKKYSYRKVSKRIKNLFRPSEAFRAFKKCKQLLAAEVSVVKPVLAITYRHDIWTVDSLFITEDFQGMNLRDYLAYEDYSLELKREIIKRLAEFWFELYQLKFLNGDPNIVNILIRFNQEKFELGLVDVDNIKKLPFIPWKMVIKNLIKFTAHTYSNLDGFGRDKLDYEDRMLFFKEFFSYFNHQEDIDELIDYINQKTVEKLIDWDKKELIISDKKLSDFYI